MCATAILALLQYLSSVPQPPPAAPSAINDADTSWMLSSSAAVLLSAVVALQRVIPDKLSLSFCFGAAPPFSLLLRALKALLRETAEVAEACSAFLAWAAQEAAEATAAERSAAAGAGEGGVTLPPRQQPAKALAELRCTAAALQGATDESMSVLHGLLGTATVDQASE